MHLCDSKREIGLIFIDQIPCIACQFSFHVSEKTGRSKDMEFLFSTQENPQQVVKPDEMIHVRVGHKDVGDFKQISC